MQGEAKKSLLNGRGFLHGRLAANSTPSNTVFERCEIVVLKGRH
jgi:hypothetical protein